jgi:hypothetical protein
MCFHLPSQSSEREIFLLVHTPLAQSKNQAVEWNEKLMPPLPVIALPLPPHGPPPGYGWADRDMSTTSSSTAFRRGLEDRDRFLGEVRCVVCGVETFQRCHVIMQSEVDVVSGKGPCVSFLQVNRKHSGPISSVVIGSHSNPKTTRQMNRAMD